MPNALTVLSAAVATVKKLREVSQKIKDAETRNLIAELSMSLADLKLEIAQLKDENVSLKKQLESATEQPDLRANLELKDGVYFFAHSVPGHPDGPYCPTCFDVNELLVIVTPLEPPFDTFGKYRCNNCKGTFS